jgi:hypothetical protein
MEISRSASVSFREAVASKQLFNSERKHTMAALRAKRKAIVEAEDWEGPSFKNL